MMKMVRLPLLQQRDKQDEQHDNNPLSEELWELCLCGLQLSSCLLLSAESKRLQKHITNEIFL